MNRSVKACHVLRDFREQFYCAYLQEHSENQALSQNVAAVISFYHEFGFKAIKWVRVALLLQQFLGSQCHVLGLVVWRGQFTLALILPDRA